MEVQAEMRRDYGPTRPSAYYESAYDLAVRRGYRGTLDEWLASLRGAPGPAYGNVVSVSSYGAAGDGVTDDTQAVKDALQAAGIGGTVLLDADKAYLVTQTLNMADGQTIDGNGATLLWEGEAPDGNIRNAPPIIHAAGVLRDELDILEPPVSVGYPSSTESGEDNPRGFTTIKVGADPGYKTGDRIIIQAIRNAMSEESGAYWVGTTTANSAPCWWAEPLVVNHVEQTGDSEWTIQCVGALTYPYYLTGAEDGVDISAETEPVYVDEDGYRAESGTLVGYQLVPGGASHLRGDCSTVRKVDFLRGVCIRDLTVLARGKTHTGDRGEDPDGWVGASEGNTILLSLCEDALIDNVRIVKADAGRGMRMDNCLNSMWRGCAIENDYRLYDANETHVRGNFYSFESCWYCTAEGCTSIRGGQSFDTGYGAGLRCPSLYITVRNCTVIQSLDNAATNHSGNWGMTFDGCRFIGCAAPLLVRSPMTTVRRCSFSGSWGGTPEDEDYPGTYDPAYDNWSVALAEPTLFGCTVEDCTFAGGKGVRIGPYQIRYFNFQRGNYLNGGNYVQIGEAVTGGNPFPPEKKALNIRIADNIFKGTQGALFIKMADRWCKNAAGKLTEYAKMDLCVDFDGNTLTEVGAHYQPILIDDFVNGLQIRENRFVRCVSHVAYDPITGEQTEWPYYIRKGDVWKPAETPYLIRTGGDNVRIAIEDNTVSECGGGFLYLYNTLSVVRSDMGTNGVAEFITRSNRIDKRVSGGTDMAIAQTDADVERSFVNVGKQAAERTVDSVDVGAAMGLGSGLRYEFSPDNASVSITTFGRERFRVQHDAAFSPNEAAKTPGCLLRTWTGASTGTYTMAFRLAVYPPIERTIEGETVLLPVTQDMYERVSACWDAGVDEAGNAVTFASAVVLVTTDTDDDGNVSETTMTVPAPLNAPLSYTTADARRSVDADIGKVTVSGTGACACFSVIPTGYAPSLGDRVTVFSEIFDNTSFDGNSLRVDSVSGNVPSIFDRSIMDKTVPAAPITDGPGIITMYELAYNPPEQMDLGTAQYPWKTVHTENLSLAGGLAVSVAAYGAVGNGTTDDTAAIKAAFDSGAAKVIFGKGKTYKLTSTVTCKRDVEVDFNGANFVMATGTMFEFAGTDGEPISAGDYAKNQVDYTLPDGNDYSGMAFMLGGNRFDKHRTYYYAGFPTVFQSGEIVIPYPIDVTSGYWVDVDHDNETVTKRTIDAVQVWPVTPVRVKLHNMGSVTFGTASTDNKAVCVVYGYNCEIDNMACTATEAYDVIELDRCLYTTIRDSSIRQDVSSTSNSYLIGVISSCYTSIERCDLYNRTWHCITTGGSNRWENQAGHQLAYHTVISSCSCVSEGQPAVSDHPNARNTIIKDSSIAGINLHPMCMIENVDVYAREKTQAAYISVYGGSDLGEGVYHISNVRLHTTQASTSNGIQLILNDTQYGVQTNYTNTDDGSPTDPYAYTNPVYEARVFYLDDVHVNNVECDAAAYLFIDAQNKKNETGRIGNVYVDDSDLSYCSLNFGQEGNADTTAFNLYLTNVETEIRGVYNNLFLDNVNITAMGTAYTTILGNLRGNYAKVVSSRFGNLLAAPVGRTVISILENDGGRVCYNVNREAGETVTYYTWWNSGTLATGRYPAT